ncbi:MAG: PQQ-dependent sugar dehydrogenase [Verrucomicrobia bacterium]|nr:PQQ-dependent sugar dehydrogenase [Verrucomicrobiota bacterium]
MLIRLAFKAAVALIMILAARAAEPLPETAVDDPARFRKVVLSTHLLEPIQLSPAADGRIFFGERHGAVKVWRPETQDTITLGQLEVFSGPEDGLLGLALDPGFLTNHWLYLFHSQPGALENRVSRFTIEGDRLDAASGKTLLRIPTLAKKPNHSGGGLGFDAAGNLYTSTGDYTFINDSNGFSPLDERPGREVFDSQRTAANTMDLRGKILRIHPLADGTYSIPSGNLFPPGTPDTLPEIYIMGCRNPFRFTLDAETGWLIWGDVGPDALGPDPRRGPAGFDEFNLAKSAGNFGWPYFVADNKPYVKYDFGSKESGASFNPAHPVNTSPNNTGLKALPPAHPALIWYPPGPSTRFPELGSGPRSAMAGPIYHFNEGLKSDRKLPKRFDRSLFIFEWERGWIQEVRLDSFGQLESIHRFLPHMTFKRPISMAFGPDGAMYLIEWGSAWYDNKDAQLVRIESVPLVPL